MLSWDKVRGQMRSGQPPTRCASAHIDSCPRGYRVKSGKIGRSAKFGQRPCLSHNKKIK